MFPAFFLFRKGGSLLPLPHREGLARPLLDSSVSIHSLCKLVSAVKHLKDVSDLMVHYFHCSLHKATFQKSFRGREKVYGATVE